MTDAPINDIAQLFDAFEDDVRIDLLRAGPDGAAPLPSRYYTKARPALGWVPCADARCHLGGFDIPHELLPLVFAGQRAAALGTAGRHMDSRLTVRCGGKTMLRGKPCKACVERFTIHLSGTLRQHDGIPPSAEVARA